MANLYITEQNSIIRKTGDRLRVHKEDTMLAEIKCNKLEAVLIFGNVQFTTQVVHELMEHNIELAVLTRSGRLIGQLTSPTTKNIELRLNQFRCYDDFDFRLAYAKTLMAAKLANSRQVLTAYARNHPEIDLSGIVRELIRYESSVEDQRTLESLRGLEGSAARGYFGAFAKMNRSDLPFEGRRKRPPTDPINALLSLGYTMLFNEISSLLDGMGFDPYLGYYHVTDYGRASLAADLIEPFRAPVVDRFTLKAVNLGMFKTADFKKNPRGDATYLKREALKRYFAAYDKFLNSVSSQPKISPGVSLRAHIRTQAEQLASSLKNKTAFMPFNYGT